MRGGGWVKESCARCQRNPRAWGVQQYVEWWWGVSMLCALWGGGGGVSMLHQVVWDDGRGLQKCW